MIELKVFPQKITAYNKRGKHRLYYSILPHIEDVGTLIVYNPFYAQCLSFDKENLFQLIPNKPLKGSLLLDLSKGAPFKEIKLSIEIRTINTRTCSNQQIITISSA